MRIGIIGWGVEGQSAYRYFGPDNDYLICSEEPRDDFPPQSDKVKVQFINAARPPGLTGNVTDTSYLAGIEHCDKVIYSVVAPKNLEKLFPPGDKFWDKALTVQDLFFKEVKTRNIIGITGTKGKGTTSTLVAKMLEACGERVHLGGNIGRSVLDFASDVQPDDWVVLELSNFQLYRLKYSPRIALCLMITPEHMDWHASMDEYVAAKANIFRWQKPDDIAIYLPTNRYSQEIAGYSHGVKVPYFAPPGAFVREDGMIVVGQAQAEVIKTSQLKLIGRHNWQNVCAAITAVWSSLNEPEGQSEKIITAIRSVLGSFSGLPHRLEFVRELDFVKYYDDSFGTTPDTTIVAINAFAQPVVLILGGHDKGVSFDALIDQIAGQERVRHVIAIGDTGPKLAAMLRAKGYMAITEGLTDMVAMVAEARARAQPGDVVLLSTGCSSFGLFADYKDRGNQFKSAVQEL